MFSAVAGCKSEPDGPWIGGVSWQLTFRYGRLKVEFSKLFEPLKRRRANPKNRSTKCENWGHPLKYLVDCLFDFDFSSV
jgi:hypothetical protein